MSPACVSSMVTSHPASLVVIRFGSALPGCCPGRFIRLPDTPGPAAGPTPAKPGTASTTRPLALPGLNPPPSWLAQFDGVGLGVVAPGDRDRDIGKDARGRVDLVAVGAGIRVSGVDGDRGVRVRGGRG